MKDSSKVEAPLMKKYGFKNDWFYTVTDKRADSIDIDNFYFELQLIQFPHQNNIQLVQNYLDYTFSHVWAYFSR